MVEVIAAIDTNVFISVINKESDYLDSKKILDWIDEGKIKAIISTIVLAEVCSGYDAEEESKEKDEFLAHIIGSPNYEIVEVSVSVALDAGNLRSKSGYKLPDSIIISSAIRRGVEFLISNDAPVAKRDYDLEVVSTNEFVKEFEARIRKESNKK